MVLARSLFLVVLFFCMLVVPHWKSLSGRSMALGLSSCSSSCCGVAVVPTGAHHLCAAAFFFPSSPFGFVELLSTPSCNPGNKAWVHLVSTIFFVNSLWTCPDDCSWALSWLPSATMVGHIGDLQRTLPVFCPCPSYDAFFEEQLSPPHPKWCYCWGMLDGDHYTHTGGAAGFGVWAWFKREEMWEGNVVFSGDPGRSALQSCLKHAQ